MKPKHSLFFVLGVMLVLGIVSLLIPEDGWKITKNVTINFPTFERIIHPEETDYADISKIIKEHGDTTDLQDIAPGDSLTQDTARADADSLRKSVHPIIMTESGRKKLHSFFSKLGGASKAKKPVRVWHYGDSQVESGRITSFIRERLQASFGGRGPGLLPLVPVTQKLSWRVKPSGSWERHTLFGKLDTTLPHKKFGPMLSLFRFSPFPVDTIPNDSMVYKGKVHIKNSFQGYKHASSYERAVLHFGDNNKPFSFKISDKEGEEIYSDSLPASNSWQALNLPLGKSKNEFNLSFAGYDSPDFYGLSLESKNGVIVDNIAMRGSSGLIFTRMNYGFYLRQLQRFDVDLIILQFGVNVVSEETESFNYYESWIYSQLQTIKKMRPDLPVIVIGLSDMAKKVGTKYQSYESVAKIRDALKNASQRAGFCFWDLYEAMGGENSMPSWVFAKPPLAGKDFTHFNHRGARIISNMFYNALMSEYRNYLNQAKESNE